MNRISRVGIVVIIIAALGTTFCFTEGYFQKAEKSSAQQELVLSTMKPDGTSTVAPTATPAPTAKTEKVKKAKLGEKQVLLGEQSDVVEYLESLSDQEWLTLATVSESYYSRVKDGDVIVAIDGKEVNAFENAETSEKISVLRYGNAFCVEPKEGEIVEDMSEKLPTMSDKGIYNEAFCGEHVALCSNATIAKCFPKAVNMLGSLSKERSYNPEILKALVLVKYQATDADGNEIEVHAIAWKVCDCTGRVTSTRKNNGGGSGSSGKPNPSKPSVEPTKVPENNSEPKVDPTLRPENGSEAKEQENNSEPSELPTPRPESSADKESGNSSQPKDPVKKSETVVSSGNAGTSSFSESSGSSGTSSSEMKADPTPKTSGASDAPVKKNEEW